MYSDGGVYIHFNKFLTNDQTREKLFKQSLADNLFIFYKILINLCHKHDNINENCHLYLLGV